MISVRALSVYLLVLGSSWGCATPPQSSLMLSPSAPFFNASSEDVTQLAMLASELDTRAAECAGEHPCDDRVHFSRALISLFENREAARASFEQVISLHPSSPFATSSALWLQLLKDEGLTIPPHDPQRRLLIDLTQQWMREWMAPQQRVQANDKKTTSLSPAPDVQSLHKKVHERDRRIADLRAQLDALKAIDQDQLDRRKITQPAPLVPKIERQR